VTHAVHAFISSIWESTFLSLLEAVPREELVDPADAHLHAVHVFISRSCVRLAPLLPSPAARLGLCAALGWPFRVALPHGSKRVSNLKKGGRLLESGPTHNTLPPTSSSTEKENKHSERACSPPTTDKRGTRTGQEGHTHWHDAAGGQGAARAYPQGDVPVGEGGIGPFRGARRVGLGPLKFFTTTNQLRVTVNPDHRGEIRLDWPHTFPSDIDQYTAHLGPLEEEGFSLALSTTPNIANGHEVK
jgi:hypothetical protein